MTRGRLLALLAVLALLATAAATADTGRARLVEAGNTVFPDRKFALTTATAAQLTSRNISVSENGQPVTDVTVVPVGQAVQGSVGVVLALDASWSMRGAPIAAALDAARAFVKARAASELIGLVTFNRSVANALAPTADTFKILQAIASTPHLAVGTRIYDGVDAALALLQQAKVNLGSIILLSDGRDTGSKLKFAKLVDEARAAHVRVFTVGLRSKQFSSATLQAIAAKTGAGYAEADTPSALASIYRALSARLSDEYLLEYKSLAGPDTVVHVRVRVNGAPVSSASYRTPALPTHALAPFHRSWFDRFVLSGGSAALVALLVGLLVAAALVGFARGGRFALRKRMAQFVSLVDADRRDEAASKLTAAVERTFAGKGWWGRFSAETEIAQFRLTAAQVFLLTLAATVFLTFIVLVALPPVLIVFSLLGPALVARYLIKRKLNERRSAFGEQLPDNLSVLAAALRVGHSFSGALSVMLEEADEPARAEFRRAITDEQLGVPVEDALLRVADRMDSGDLRQVALVASLQRQTGGNTAQVLDTVVDTIRERGEIRRLVKTLTTQGRFARWILTALPFVMLFLFTTINAAYMHPLFHTTSGQILLVVAVSMMVLGSAIIGRIVNIKV
jgi:tight adherence protein B